MKGIRTYQILFISLLLAITSSYDWDNVISSTEQLIKLLEVICQFYLTFLTCWKVIVPHPMKHE